MNYKKNNSIAKTSLYSNVRMGDILASQIIANKIQELELNSKILETKKQNSTKVNLNKFIDNNYQTQLYKNTDDLKDNFYISPEEIYNYFLKYFKSLDEFFPQSRTKDNYHFSSFWCGEIFLSLLENNQSIVLIKDKNTIYQANFENGQWYEIQNKLLPDQIQKIKQLPHNKQEITTEYSGRYLVRLLSNKLIESKSIQKKIKWKFFSENCKDKYYSFQIQQILPSKQIVISGKNEDDLNIFSAKMHQNGFIDVLKNQIPLKHIDNLIDQQTRQLT